jgi:hypothetical protein
MKAHAIFTGIFTGIAGALLLTVAAGGAHAQARITPDASACNDLTGGALVACQNQVYREQLESGISGIAADPAEVPSSHIEGNEATLPDFVPGAEGTEPPGAGMPTAAPSVLYSLPGPEGVQVYGPTE